MLTWKSSGKRTLGRFGGTGKLVLEYSRKRYMWIRGIGLTN